jgi:hypothetical protein
LRSPGTCPECSALIQSQYILIAYKTTDQIECFAECSACLTLVHPERDPKPIADPDRKTSPSEQ